MGDHRCNATKLVKKSSESGPASCQDLPPECERDNIDFARKPGREIEDVGFSGRREILHYDISTHTAGGAAMVACRERPHRAPGGLYGCTVISDGDEAAAAILVPSEAVFGTTTSR